MHIESYAERGNSRVVTRIAVDLIFAMFVGLAQPPRFRREDGSEKVVRI
jgi:hypothetical protein